LTGASDFDISDTGIGPGISTYIVIITSTYRPDRVVQQGRTQNVTTKVDIHPEDLFHVKEGEKS